MSSFSKAIHDAKEKNLVGFFGEVKHASSKYISFKHVIDDDNIIVNVKSVVSVKGSPVLAVGSCSGVYLKDWLVREAHVCKNGVDEDFWCVKLNRKFFKVYTFKNPLTEDMIEDTLTFDEWMQVARLQDEESMPIALGHMGA